MAIAMVLGKCFSLLKLNKDRTSVIAANMCNSLVYGCKNKYHPVKCACP